MKVVVVGCWCVVVDLVVDMVGWLSVVVLCVVVPCKMFRPHLDIGCNNSDAH
jgi:hypothetical protein